MLRQQGRKKEQVKAVVQHEGVVYIIYYEIANNTITVKSIFNQKHISKLEIKTGSENCMIKEGPLMRELISKFKVKLINQYQ